MDRFFVDESQVCGNQVVLVRQQAHQIRDVLRLRPGDSIIVLDNAGWEYQVTLTAIRHEQVIGEIVQKRPAGGEPKVHLTLYQTLLTRDKFEFVLQKCTEIGVCEFVPVITQRSIVCGQMPGREKFDRWQKIITEAAEQCERGRIPQLREATVFEKVISDTSKKYDYRLIASTSPGAKNLHEALTSGSEKPTNIALFIGPEGGFTEDEVRLACDKGAAAVNLGKRILRTETAAIVASALILYELGEIRP